jgi:hypothetical protein
VENEFGVAIAVDPDDNLYVAGTTFGPPPYKSRQASKKTATPISFVDIPSVTVTTPAGSIGDPNGILLIPDGSQSFAGGSDAALLKIVP